MAAKELNVINPYTEEAVLALPMTTMEEIDRIVESGQEAFYDWKQTSFAERATLCKRFMEVFAKMGGNAAADITVQMGKPRKQAIGEVRIMLERAEYMIDIAAATLKDEALPEKDGFTRYIRHEPKGVVLDIAAWNYPLLIAVNVVVPAVMAGNAVIVKHSSRTPLCGKAFVQAFAMAGAPEGLVQDVVADHETTDALIKHRDVNHVSFTGSVRGGHEVVQSAAGTFIDVGLELGGKDPAYVCADAPFDFAVENCVDGAFYNAGQSCCAIERIYVDQDIYENFVEAYAAAVRQYKLGDPAEEGTTLGPLATPTAKEFLEGQIKDAVDKGGKLVVSPDEFDTPDKGWFLAPSVVAGCPHECSLAQEESFGPVIAIMPVKNEIEAVTLMNDSPYGLTASIWTEDTVRAIRVGERIETGTFFMNRCDYLEPGLPWTGVKDTGRGATLSHYGYLNLTQLKSIHLRTELPE